jgi:hypothetical protein
MIRWRRSCALAAIACALAIAACGSARKSSGAGSSGYSQGVKYSDCMRAHGVPNFPDPTANGGIPPILAGSGINFFSPAFEAAQSTCHKLAPGGGPGSGPAHASPATAARWLRISECMRRHDVPDFPDPTSSMPPPDSNAYSFISDQNSVVVAVPATINSDSPAFRQAAAACNWQLPSQLPPN